MGGTEDARCIFLSDEVSIAVSSYLYRLRMAEALISEDAMLVTPRARLYVTSLLQDMREAAEDAASAIEELRAGARLEAEAHLGKEQF